MRPKISFNIIGGNVVPPTTTSITLTVNGYFYTKTTACEFVTTPTAGKVTIGATVEDTTANLAQFMYDIWAADLDCIEKIGNDVFINALGISVTIDTKYGEYIEGDIEPDFMLCRSPYHLRIKPIGYVFDSAVTEIRVWRGDVYADRPTDPTHVVSKGIINTGQDTIDFVVSEFAADSLKSEFENYYDQLSVNSFSSAKESVWVECSTKIYNTGSEILSGVRQWIGLDGFGKHEHGMNPKVPLNMNSVSNGVFYGFTPIYYRANDVGITLLVNGAPAIGLDYAYGNENILNIYVFSVKCTDLTSITYGDVITIKDNDGNTLINLTYLCTGKYPVYNLIYKNRFGVWNGIPFPMRNRTTLKRESTTFMPVISSFGKYNITDHAKRTYKPKLTKTVTLNTDFIPEDYNNAFEDLMLSEFVYLQTDETTFIPCNVVTDSLQMKQKTFEKLIQYTIDVEVSNNVMNTVY